MKIECPHCDGAFSVNIVTSVKASASPGPPVGKVDAATRDRLTRFAEELEGRYTNEELVKAWLDLGETPVPMKSIVAVLRGQGATPWRTATTRGWDLPSGVARRIARGLPPF